MKPYTNEERTNILELFNRNMIINEKSYSEAINEDEEGVYYYDNVILIEEESLNDIISFLEWIDSDYEGTKKNLSYDLYHDYIVYMKETNTYLYVIG